MVSGLAGFKELARLHQAEGAAGAANGAARGVLIPVTRAVLTDLETPVAAFWKLRRGPWSFLLESVEGGEQWARFTLLGTEPRAVLTARGNKLRIERPAKTGPSAVEETTVTGPLGALGAVLDRYTHTRLTAAVDATPGNVATESPTLPRFFGGLVGAVSYDAGRQIEKLPDRHKSGPGSDAPELVFLETRIVLVWDNLKHRAMLVYLAEVPDAGGPDGDTLDTIWNEALAALDEAEARLAGPLPPLPTSPDPEPGEVYTALDDRTYGAMVERAREYIGAGDIIQCVLSRRFLQARRGLHPYLVYRTLRALNPSPYMFYLELAERALVGASPELLVRRDPPQGTVRGQVAVRPIAGTRPRGATPEADRALEAELRVDPKEVAEHVMLVDLGRNDVGRVAEPGSVAVGELMIVERYSHVMHLVSEVTGALRDGVTPAETLAATFPAGTLSGAPKIRAMEIIDELETSRRGFYGGAIGTLGVNGTVDLAIAIRTLVADDSTFAVQAGAGIVWDSVPEREADETRSKASAVLRAIDLARRTFRRRERS